MLDVTILQKVQLFAGLAAEDLAPLRARMRRRHYLKDQIIFAEGDPGASLFVIETGRVKIALRSPEGKELVLSVLGSGEAFGELALLDGGPRSADAVALEPCQLLLLRREDFLGFVEERPRVALRLLAVVGRWLRNATQVARDEAFLDVPARLARVLLSLADSAETPGTEPVVITAPLSQVELAAMIGATRESVNKCLGLFERQGVIQRAEGTITIVRPEALRQRLS